VTESRSRVVFPLILSIGLFALYGIVKREPIRIGEAGDVREIIFGKSERGLLFVAVLALIFVMVRIFDRLAFDFALSRRRRVAVPQLLRDLVAIILYFVLVSWTVSEIFEYSLTKWLAATTVLAAILGLALQETLGNLFSGIALHMEDSYKVGDVMKSGDFIGVVENVTWRATKMRTFNNDIVILPNSLLARERIEVFPRDRLNGRILTVGIDYNVPPATVIGILTQAVSHVDGVSREIPCFARVGSFGDSSVNYEVKYYTRDYSARDRIDADIRKAIWYALRRNSISIPFPIRANVDYEPPTHDAHELSPENVRDRLKNVDILAALPSDAHDSLADAAQVHFYSRGETIITVGSAGESMFIVHEGTVSVRIAENGAGRREVAQLVAGSVFGEMALLTGETRNADVVALTDVTAIEIGKDALQPVLHDHPDFASVISSKVTERRARSHELQSSVEDEEITLVTRIRSWFGL
jgi:small-conductance mechanosensitive channel